MRRTASVELLSAQAVEAVHAGTLDVLQRTGVVVLEDEALGLLADVGCDIDRAERRVRFPPDRLEHLIRLAPSQFTWHARDPRRSIVLGDGSVHFGTTFGTATIVDPDGTRRSSTYEDAVKYATLIDALPNVAEGSCAFLPGDVPKEVQWAYAFLVTVKKSTKPIRGRVYGREQAKASIKIAEMIAGGTEQLRRRPLLVANINTVSPLTHHQEQTEALIEYARHGQPVIVSPEVASGGTGPVTLAGSLVEHNAEVLSGIAIAQAANPGTPVVYGQVSSVLDLRTGTFAYGAAEHGLLNAATAQMARHYGLPSRGNAGFSDSQLMDMQAGYETAMTIAMAALGGHSYIFGAVSGTLDSGLSLSLEKVLVDDEIAGYVRRTLLGIEVSDATVAAGLIQRVGPGGSYLGELHTLEHMKVEHYFPPLANRRSYVSWREAGANDIRERARAQLQQILREHTPQPLDAKLEREMEQYVDAVRRTALER